MVAMVHVFTTMKRNSLMIKMRHKKRIIKCSNRSVLSRDFKQVINMFALLQNEMYEIVIKMYNPE